LGRGGENVKGNGSCLDGVIGDGGGSLLEDDGVGSSVSDGRGKVELSIGLVNNCCSKTVDEGNLVTSAQLGGGDGDALSQLCGGSVDGGSGEGLDGKSSVGARAAGDQRSSQRVNFVKVQWGVVGVSESIAEGGAGLNPSRVSGLGGQDGSSGSQVGWVGDVLGSSEVSRDTDTLEELRGGDEAGRSSDTKVVLAFSNGG